MNHLTFRVLFNKRFATLLNNCKVELTISPTAPTLFLVVSTIEMIVKEKLLDRF